MYQPDVLNNVAGLTPTPIIQNNPTPFENNPFGRIPVPSFENGNDAAKASVFAGSAPTGVPEKKERNNSNGRNKNDEDFHGPVRMPGGKREIPGNPWRSPGKAYCDMPVIEEEPRSPSIIIEDPPKSDFPTVEDLYIKSAFYVRKPSLFACLINKISSAFQGSDSDPTWDRM